MSVSIGEVRKNKDGSFDGQLVTLAFQCTVKIVPVAKKASPKSPDFVVRSGRAELGAGWIKTGKESGEDYVSLVFKGPGIGKVFANLGKMAGQDDDDVFAVIWNEPKEA
jgi:uncharacterized protein (DUF736 family)